MLFEGVVVLDETKSFLEKVSCLLFTFLWLERHCSLGECCDLLLRRGAFFGFHYSNLHSGCVHLRINNWGCLQQPSSFENIRWLWPSQQNYFQPCKIIMPIAICYKKWNHQAHFWVIITLKLKLRVVLVCIVAMITYFAIKITIIGSPIARQLCDNNIMASLDKQWLY